MHHQVCPPNKQRWERNTQEDIWIWVRNRHWGCWESGFSRLRQIWMCPDESTKKTIQSNKQKRLLQWPTETNHSLLDNFLPLLFSYCIDWKPHEHDVNWELVLPFFVGFSSLGNLNTNFKFFLGLWHTDCSSEVPWELGHKSQNSWY